MQNYQVAFLTPSEQPLSGSAMYTIIGKERQIPRKKWHQIAHSLACRVSTNYCTEIQKPNVTGTVFYFCTFCTVNLYLTGSDKHPTGKNYLYSCASKPTRVSRLPAGKMALRSLCLKVQSDEVNASSKQHGEEMRGSHHCLVQLQ